MKKSTKTAAIDLKEVPFLAVQVFRDHPSPFASLAAPPVGKGKRPFTADEMAFRESHVAIEKVRRAPTPAALLTLLRGLLPDLKVSPQQTTVQLAWAEVLLREATDEERFEVRGEDMGRFALAARFLDQAAPLRGAPPFCWLLPYLEAVFALASAPASPPIAAERAAAALEAATAAGEALATRSALRRLLEAAEGLLGADPGVRLQREGTGKKATKGPGKGLGAERRPGKRGGKEDGLRLLTPSKCIVLGEYTIPLSPREFALIRATVLEGPLDRNLAAEYLAKQPPRSSMATPDFVDADAPRDHRKHILAKVEKEAGLPWRKRLAAAFRCGRGVFLYDPKVLPVFVE